MIPANSSEKVQDLAERLSLKSFLIHRTHIIHKLRDKFSNVILPISSIALTPLVYCLLPAGIAFAPAAALIIIPAGTLAIISELLDRDVDDFLFSKNAGKAYSATHDQSGWNWSERAKSIDSQKFDLLLKQIQSDPFEGSNAADHKLRMTLNLQLQNMEENYGIEFNWLQ